MRGGYEKNEVFSFAEWRGSRPVGQVLGIVGVVERCRSARVSGPIRHVRATGTQVDPFPHTVASRLRCGACAARARKGLPMFSRLSRVVAAAAVAIALSATVGTVGNAGRRLPVVAHSDYTYSVNMSNTSWADLP